MLFAVAAVIYDLLCLQKMSTSSTCKVSYLAANFLRMQLSGSFLWRETASSRCATVRAKIAATICRLTTVCLKKNIPDIFSCNSRKHCRIFVMFGTHVIEKVSNQ